MRLFCVLALWLLARCRPAGFNLENSIFAREITINVRFKFTYFDFALQRVQESDVTPVFSGKWLKGDFARAFTVLNGAKYSAYFRIYGLLSVLHD